MATLTAQSWVLAAARRLGSHGVDHVRVEPLAAELGVSKGSFYWHFEGREALLAAVLEMWESQGTEAIIITVNEARARPADRLRALITHTFGQPEHDGIELGIRAWARHDDDVRAVVERVDTRRVTYVTRLLEEAGLPKRHARSRAEILYRALIGEFVLRSHGYPALPAGALAALAASLLESP